MKAAYYEGAGRIRIGDSPAVPPGRGEVQIRVSHAGICGTDLHIFHGRMDHRVHPPRVIGHEMSGTVEAAGDGVEGFRPGDRVTVRPLDYCGDCPSCRAGHVNTCYNLKVLGIDAVGAFQPLWTVPARTLHRLPATVSFAQGAMIEPLACACRDVRAGEVRAGEHAVVQGCGPIGVLIALVLRAGAARVLLSGTNPFRLELARSLGLETVNPRDKDLATLVLERTSGAGADVVFEVSGSAAGAESMTKLPRSQGRIVMVALYPEPPRVDLFRFFWRELRMAGARVYEAEDFERAIALAGAGALPLERIVSRTVPLVDIETGFRQMERGGEVMKILVRCGE